MKKIILNLIFVFLCVGVLNGQNTIYFKNGFDFYQKNELDSALFYFNKDLKFNKKGHDTIRAFDYLYLGKIYKLQQKIPEALQFFNAAEVLFKKHNNYNNLAFLYATIAEFYRAKFDYLSSKKYLKLCEEIINNQKVSKKNIAYFWSRKAALFIEYDEDIESSLKSSKKVLAIAKEIKDKDLEASALNEIGYVYENTKIQLAETYYLQALRIYEQQQKPIYQLDLIINLSRLGGFKCLTLQILLIFYVTNLHFFSLFGLNFRITFSDLCLSAVKKLFPKLSATFIEIIDFLLSDLVWRFKT